jgi:hypothetical protein
MAIGSRSSVAETNPEWARWILPSVADLIFVALLALLTFTALSVRLLGDAGIGWHIRTGQIILSTHTVPRVDPFSPTAAATSSQPWFAWEWLYDVLAGWLDTAAGLNGVVLLTAVVIAAVFAWTFRIMLRRGTNVLLAVILLLLAASAAMIHFLARPHVVSWLFTVAWFCILESSARSGEIVHSGSGDSTLRPGIRRISLLWLLPPLTALWVNVHGGLLVGFVLLAIFWVDALWRWLRPAGDRFDDVLKRIQAGRRFRTLTFVGLLSAAATLVNPYGFKLHIHIYGYLSNRFLMDHIDEFQSPNFHYVAQKCFAGLLLLTLAALALRKRQANGLGVRDSLVILFAAYSGLYASRNIPVSSLLLILMIGPGLSDAIETLAGKGRSLASTRFLKRMQAIELNVRGHLWPVAAILLISWIAAHGGTAGSKQLMNAHFDAKRFPVAAVNYFESQNLPGPVVSPDYWGGYLIYRLYPRVGMVVDDRHDFYGEEFLKSYLKMVHVEPGWQDFIQQHPARCVIVQKDSALANILAETANWQSVYRDDVAVIFVRTGASSK